MDIIRLSDITKRSEFWRRMVESGGFDVEHLMETKPASCLVSVLDNGDYPTQLLVYAKMGIHKYNMLQGTNLQLSCVEKYNLIYRVHYLLYYITLVAKDPAAGGSLVRFQTNVVEQGGEKLMWDIARPKPGPQENLIQHLEPVDIPYRKELRLPKWPSENAFTDKNRFYVLNESELPKYDWIRLYLQLAFLKANFKLQNPDLAKLVIVMVAVETKETVEPPSERLEAGNAIVYIRYKYHLDNGPSPRDRDRNRNRIAIVRRTMDKNTGLFTLMFDDASLKL